MTRLIAFIGPAGSGKTTAARTLRDAYAFSLIPLAGPLKLMLHGLGLSTEQLYGSLKEAPCPLLCNQTPRRAMQTLGTEWGRDIIGENIWINAWKQKASRYLMLCHENKVVVDDCRFSNEAKVIRKMGGLIIEIIRPELDEIETSNHESETLLDINPDLSIVNEGDIEGLKAMIRELYNSDWKVGEENLL